MRNIWNGSPILQKYWHYCPYVGVTSLSNLNILTICIFTQVMARIDLVLFSQSDITENRAKGGNCKGLEKNSILESKSSLGIALHYFRCHPELIFYLWYDSVIYACSSFTVFSFRMSGIKIFSYFSIWGNVLKLFLTHALCMHVHVCCVCIAILK